MPALSNFFGITVTMAPEVGGPQGVPHFHAYYGDQAAVYSIEVLQLVAGDLPPEQKRLLEAWARLHRQELMADWQSLHDGRVAAAIDPLR